ncbi:TlpA family protein disulfide reductase [Mucilaginibacter rigui]|uniref:TlpA family protein disulfide reductase n=1 Tax=Mucilaginibacter rigui TaxID=534635 RepID=A0ABR7X5N2_9SPHI|nr:TlpA disulfide reductase family protein [Mucilaginibacter rigui]MBD1385888.1 TlpA family protein disulfide reductase [Mucilaginibacter rigui]
MKKYIILSAINLFCGLIKAQTNMPPPAGLKIGDQVPNFTINTINHKSTPPKLSAFKGKIVILDFWATWCSPCVGMISKMDSLQTQFAGSIQFIPVTSQSEKIVTSFLARYNRNRPLKNELPEVAGDVELRKLFPHFSLPHYVWIDPNGIVAAITDEKSVTAENIKDLLAKKNIDLSVKTDIRVPYKRDKPLFVGANGGEGSAFIYHSLIAGYTPGLPLGWYMPLADSNKMEKVTMVNGEPLTLFQLAYRDKGRFNRNRVQVLSKDSMIIMCHANEPVMEWFKKNSFCYDLFLPAKMAKHKFSIFKEDLRRLFPDYEATVQKQTRRYLALQRTSTVDKLKSTGGEQEWIQDQFGMTLHYQNFTRFYWELDNYFFSLSPIPLVDETGIKGAIDIKLEANMSNVASLNKALANYDLRIVEKTGDIDILVISDKPQEAE